MEGRPRVLFFGMQGNFSLPPLRALLESDIEVCAVVVPAAHVDQLSSSGSDQLPLYRREQVPTARSTLPMLHAELESGIVQLAWQRKIPLWEVYRLADPSTISTFAWYQPDVLCVACFSQRIPRAILDIARLGCLNVHPSLLPANRGPVPLFWTFRHGCRQTGVTIHFMDEGMDSGAILAQEVIPVADGISYVQLELDCASHGGKLLSQTVWDLYQGVAVPYNQDEKSSSYYGFPSNEDFVVPVADWDAEHVYNFICGVTHWNGPIVLQFGDERVTVQKATTYSQEDTDDLPFKHYFWQDNELWIRCKRGWVAVVNPVTFQ
jgi:methionyl-tRNA formyltransferase